jgi:hypothetical protein
MGEIMKTVADQFAETLAAAGMKRIYGIVGDKPEWADVGRIVRRDVAACANEWQRGICEKPKVKCSACPNQAFQAVDDVSIERHLKLAHANLHDVAN